jgi:hypothetical protein
MNWWKARAARAAAIRWAGVPTEITVADIIVAVDEPIDATGCAGKENCMGEDAGRCMTHDLWSSLNPKMIEYLDSISLKKLVEDQLAKGVSIEEAPIKRAISSRAGGQADQDDGSEFRLCPRRRAVQVSRSTLLAKP